MMRIKGAVVLFPHQRTQVPKMRLLHLFTLFLTSLAALALPAKHEYDKRQQLAQVITTCTTPNTIALTFVGCIHPYHRL